MVGLVVTAILYIIAVVPGFFAVNDPSMLGVDPYATWLFEFEGRPAKAMTAGEYVAFLAAGWEETVKLLKGQV